MDGSPAEALGLAESEKLFESSYLRSRFTAAKCIVSGHSSGRF